MEKLTTEQKLQIRELQNQALRTNNLRMQLKIQHDELAARQGQIEAELTKLVESFKPTKGKWTLTEDLVWKEEATS